MEYFPIFASIRNRPCLVVGGGSVAERKINMLTRAGAPVTVVAPELSPVLKENVLNEKAVNEKQDAGRLVWLSRRFLPEDVDGFDLIIAATGDTEVNRQVSESAQKHRRLVNVVDAPGLSNFISPAVVDRSPVVVAISSSGAMPVLARRIRSWLESVLPQSLGAVADAASAWRDRVKARFPDLDQRRRFWDAALDRILAGGDLHGTLTAELGQELGQEVGQEVGQKIDQKTDQDRRLAPAFTQGKVFLVGAGPGDPDLLTLKALQVMQQADVVVHDRLVSTAVLERARRDAEFIDVGKSPGSHRFTQARINKLMVNLASSGRLVCRLKGGDPGFFARAGEELKALRDAGVEVEIVPGVTAASACAAAAGFPLTDRFHAHAVTLATAHCQSEMDCLDFSFLTRPGHTQVFYMPVKQLPKLQAKLIDQGLDRQVHCALIENGTRPEQRIIRSSLGELAATARKEKVQSPALLVMGNVVDLMPAGSAMGDNFDRAALSAA